MSILRAIPRLDCRGARRGEHRYNVVDSILVSAWIALQKSPCQREPVWRLPQLRLRNLPSFPLRAGQDPRGILFAGDRATRAIEQNISGTLRLFQQVVELSSGPRSTTAAAREALPFGRGVCQAKIRTCSPRLPH